MLDFLERWRTWRCACYFPMRDPLNRPTRTCPRFLRLRYVERTRSPPAIRRLAAPTLAGIHGIWQWDSGRHVAYTCLIPCVGCLAWAGLRRSIPSVAYIPKRKQKSNISDTQVAVFEYKELDCVWQHRTWGTSDNPEYPWSFTLYGDKGTLIGSTMKYDFTPVDKEGKKIIRMSTSKGKISGRPD